MRPSIRNTVRVIALAVGSLLVVAAVAEVGIRAVYGEKFGRRPGFYVGDKRLGWRPNADLDNTFYGPEYQIRVRTDGDGYRMGALGEVDYTKDLVVVVGDSYAFGWGVSNDETFPSYLDQMLNEASKGKTRVVNLGVGGYGMFQSCDRLSGFMDTHPDVHVETVVIQHSVNDATDNVARLGYHLEWWDTQEVRKTRSRFHLVNMIGYALEILRQRNPPVPTEGADTNHPYVQDLLWSFERQGTVLRYPEVLTVNGHRLRIDVSKVAEDSEPAGLLQRETLSKLQRDLMSEALTCMHERCARLGARPVHVFIATTPEWYAREVEEIARESAQLVGVDAVIAGRMPKPEEFDGPVATGHSGGHFNARFNRLWAQRVAAVLTEN